MKNDSSGKQSYQGHFFKSQDTFSGFKNKKKGYMEMIEKFYLET